MTELVKYEAAERALAAADLVDEVLEIRSQAEAWRAYAKQAKNRDLEIRAARIRFRAERRLGEMLLASDLAKGGKPYQGGDPTCTHTEQVERPATLAEAGIDRKLSSKAQRVATMDLAEFEQALDRHAEEMRGGKGRVAMDLLQIGAEEKGRERRRNLAQVLSDTTAELPVGRQFPCAYIDCPWQRKAGIGNRAYENHYPTMTWPEILTFLRGARDVLLPDSWAFFWIPRAHLLAPVETELEVTVAATGEVVTARVEVPLAWACQLALGMDSYSTCFVWTKTDEQNPDERGLGLIAWDQDELLLLFKRGQGLPKPAGDEKFGSNHRERSREHSRKPDFYRHMIATMTGGLPVLEMFARVDAEHPLPADWQACGNQAQPITLQLDGLEQAGQVDRLVSGEDPPATPCDCQHPEATADGFAAVSVSCPLHGDADYAPALSEIDALKALSDFCFPNRAAILPAIAPDYITRGLAFRFGNRCDWSLTEAGWKRFYQLDAERKQNAERAQCNAAASHPASQDALAPPDQGKVSQPVDLSSDTTDTAVPPEERPGSKLDDELAAQCRLPLDDDEMDLQLALTAIEAGIAVDGEIARHLVGIGYVQATTTRLVVTDEGRAFLRALVDVPPLIDLPLFLPRRESLA